MNIIEAKRWRNGTCSFRVETDNGADLEITVHDERIHINERTGQQRRLDKFAVLYFNEMRWHTLGKE